MPGTMGRLQTRLHAQSRTTQVHGPIYYSGGRWPPKVLTCWSYSRTGHDLMAHMAWTNSTASFARSRSPRTRNQQSAERAGQPKAQREIVFSPSGPESRRYSTHPSRQWARPHNCVTNHSEREQAEPLANSTQHPTAPRIYPQIRRPERSEEPVFAFVLAFVAATVARAVCGRISVGVFAGRRHPGA